LAAALPRFPDDPGSLPASASNAWTVAAGRTEGGAPLLATDPHLGFQAPILWYLVRIDLPGGRVRAGASSPGVPLIVIGRNESVAWGFTTTHSDTQDLFVERLAGEGAYETPDGPRAFAVREEAIRVRGRDAPEVLRVRETRHGPVLSDLAEVVRAAPGTVVAAAMANLAPDDTAALGLLALNRARTLAEVRAAAALITSPPQNLVAADSAGRIGLYLTGRTPLRRAGDGSRPARGWDGSGDWLGFVPFDDMPHVEDPESGALANANNRVAPEGEGPFLGRDWPGDWRFRRIGELLGATARHDARGFAAMQMDGVSLLARALLLPRDAALRRLPPPEDAVAARALALLLAWDGTMAADRPEPLILAAWREAVLAQAMARTGLPPAARPAGSAEFLAFLLHPDGRGAWWCEDDCVALAGRALGAAVAGLAAEHGSDPAAWRWGNAHVARFEHPVLRFVPVLGPLVRLQAVTGGDGETLNRGSYRGGGAGDQRFAHVHGAGLRLVVDLADPDATLAVIATGQSGHPLSAHWGDLLEYWRGGTMLRLDRVPATEAGRITLLP
ncbi:MAG: penicillin acylase family protein, partial [Acetobacteraceae bacterium]|nr:penicillin acylase family protein [Acetobacteraceae bacterium]